MYLPVGSAFEQKALPAPAGCSAELRALYTAALLLSFRLHNPGSHPTGIREKWGQLNQAISAISYSAEMAVEAVALSAVAIEAAFCHSEEELKRMAEKLQNAIMAAAPLFEA